ncbi:MAG: Gmad2 immunoglobulin-like domain-containing protein [Candidatus Komeilibacteria bacterium]
MLKNVSIVVIIILVIIAAWWYWFDNSVVSPPLQEEPAVVILDDLRAGDVISSPLTFHGQARGWWFFEASFPVHILDDKDNIIATGLATASSDWMTEDYVPFTAQIKFTVPPGVKGTLVLQKDNPSGLPEHDASIILPIKFK